MLTVVRPTDADAIKMQIVPDELTRVFCARPCIRLQMRKYALMMTFYLLDVVYSGHGNSFDEVSERASIIRQSTVSHTHYRISAISLAKTL
jgi:hypothetical protein